MTTLFREVTAFAPATTANLIVGFDVLGLALQGLGDVVTARWVESPGVKIKKIIGATGSDQLPLDPQRNSAGIAALETLKAGKVRLGGISLILEKRLPIGSGLGSSASSAVAAAVAVNALMGEPLSREALIAPCLEAEARVSARHADNIVPSLLGGLTLIPSLDPLEMIPLPIPSSLHIVTCIPDLRLETASAREVLRAQYSLRESVKMSAQLATFIAACYTDDLPLLSRALRGCDVSGAPQIDPLSQARLPLITGGQEAIESAYDAGALSAGISGAGPSLFALCDAPSVAGDVGDAMRMGFLKHQVRSETHIGMINAEGARVIKRKRALIMRTPSSMEL